MRISSPILAFLTFAAAAAGSGASAPLHIDNMPLGNVVRILSARYHAPVTLTAGAQAPITGDLTGMDVRQALAEAARQAFGAHVTVLPRYIVRSAMYDKGISKQLTFTGIDVSRDTGFRDQMRFQSGSWADFAGADNGIVVPRDVARYFDLAYDDEVVLATRTRMGAFNTGTLKVKGVYETDNFFVQNLILCRFDFLQGLDLGEKDSASTLYLYLDSPARLGEKRDALASALEAKGFEAARPASDAEAINAIAARFTSRGSRRESPPPLPPTAL